MSFIFSFLDTQSQGGIEDGEEPKSAAIRELREETGIESAEIIAEVCIQKSVPLNVHVYLSSDVMIPLSVVLCVRKKK